MNENNEADPLVQAWVNQDEASTTTTLSFDPAELVASTAWAQLKDQLKLLRLNFQEGVPILVLVFFIGSGVPDAERPLAAVAGAVLILGVGAYLVITSVRHHRADRKWGYSMREQLARRLTQVSHRNRLYRSVAWWYIAPLIIAIFLVRYGLGGDRAPLLGFSLAMAALAAGIYVLNRWYARKHFEPEVHRIQAILDDFDEGVSTS